MIVLDAIEVYISISLVTALNVENNVSIYLLHLVEERTLSMGKVLDALAAMFVNVFVVSRVRIEGET